MMKIKSKQSSTIIMMCIAVILITITGIIYKQTFLKILPLYISLIVAFFQTRVSRWASLLGGINSILYAIVYAMFGLYAMAAQAILVSFSLQIFTFVRWSKHPSGESTVLRYLSGKQRIITAIITIICWIIVYKILSASDSDHKILDNTLTILGTLSSILMIFAFIEYIWIMIASTTLTIVLYFLMLSENPGQITYLIYAVYNLICIILALIQANKLYRSQQIELQKR